MEDIQIKSELIEQLIEISKDAGKAILEVYNSDFGHQIKEDLSPLTKADTLSNNIICERLKVITPDIPILSEENSDIPFSVRSQWSQYWLVDPLDGTKEFINRNDEFTVNIALISDNAPIFGLVYAPAINETFWGCNNMGSYHINSENISRKIKPQYKNNDSLRIVASRSHPSEKLTYFLENLNEEYELIEAGSSLKFCLVAKGDVDIYPRFGLTSEWDTGAGQAVVYNAGGRVLKHEQDELIYNSKESLLNPCFMVAKKNLLDQKEYILDLFSEASKR